MKYNNFNKSLLAKIIIIISLILLFICIGAIILSHTDDYSDEVEWNNYTFILPPDSTYNIHDDSLIINSSIKSYNIIIYKSNDLTDYNKYINNNKLEVVESQFNSTHKLLMNEKQCYAVIIPDELIKDNPTSNPYMIRQNVELLEFKGEDARFMSSFIASIYKR